MSSVQSFEDLIVWQKARQLVKKIYELTKQPIFSKDYGLVDQIRRAAVSVLSNISEGFERGGKDELIYFLYIAKASCGEVRAQVYVALDQGYVINQDFRIISDECRAISRLIYNFIESVKVSRYQGLKFKKKSREQIALEELQKEYPNLKIN